MTYGYGRESPTVGERFEQVHHIKSNSRPVTVLTMRIQLYSQAIAPHRSAGSHLSAGVREGPLLSQLQAHLRRLTQAEQVAVPMEELASPVEAGSREASGAETAMLIDEVNHHPPYCDVTTDQSPPTKQMRHCMEQRSDSPSSVKICHSAASQTSILQGHSP
jgi:hypothetical protein